MKKYNLRKTWENCIAMWKDVAEKWDGTKKSIEVLKAQWTERHGFPPIVADCFFCHYGYTHKKEFNKKSICPKCPAVEVAPNFGCYRYGWNNDPPRFYRNLKRLHNKWLKLHPKGK